MQEPKITQKSSYILEEIMDLLANSAVSGFNFESLKHSSTEKWLESSKVAPFIQLDVNPGTLEAYEEQLALETIPTSSKVGKTYTINERKEKLSSNIPLPMSAASYYNGYFPEIEIVESCESITKLNAYLKARRDDINAGVPGRFLHAVIGFDDIDVGTVVSSITYAFYLNESLKSQQFCTVPIINIKRSNLGSHAELKWLLDSCQIDQSSLIFEDEIDLPYYDLFGSLRIVLVKSSKISHNQEKFKHDVVEVFNCRKDESVYPWVKSVTMREDCSTCTAIAEKFALWSPEILADKSFSKLLLAGILLDTANLKDPQCSSKDKYMASLLINGAGRYGCNGFYQLLKYKMHDVTNLQVADILRKDFKKWTRLGMQPGITIY
ncbi:hypothetical protein L6164_016917 [Bauhinia variegata]|uniref:Uncharacterized protein n=1 Tax=Bauhinia variegata TaxID=167791 RepID=A0ACB9N6D8_BAUVA|nr:hypothetical protein L6164_016917 [Bauhinia variegata]